MRCARLAGEAWTALRAVLVECSWEAGQKRGGIQVAGSAGQEWGLCAATGAWRPRGQRAGSRDQGRAESLPTARRGETAPVNGAGPQLPLILQLDFASALARLRDCDPSEQVSSRSPPLLFCSRVRVTPRVRLGRPPSSWDEESVHSRDARLDSPGRAAKAGRGERGRGRTCSLTPSRGSQAPLSGLLGRSSSPAPARVRISRRLLSDSRLSRPADQSFLFFFNLFCVKGSVTRNHGA